MSYILHFGIDLFLFWVYTIYTIKNGDKDDERTEKDDYTWLYEMGSELPLRSHLQQNWNEEENYTQGASADETESEKECHDFWRIIKSMV